MRKWIIDFEGYAIVQGDTREEAEETFLLNVVPADCPIPTDIHVDYNVELYEPEVKQLSMFDTDND